MTRFLVILSLSLLFGRSSGHFLDQEDNWCDIEKNHCPRGVSHIACSEESFTYGNCDDLEVMEMTPRMKKVLLLRHNYYRNLVAGGFLQGKPSASRMMQIRWDETLEFLAKKHVEHCNFAHDGCRATGSWSTVGQNIALFESRTEDGGVEEHLASAVELWFAEHLEATVNEPLVPDQPTGHFLTMMLERNHRMGCAMARYRTFKGDVIRYNHLITCDYSDGLVIGEDTYTVGVPGSQCHSLSSYPSIIYDSLCDAEPQEYEESLEDFSDEYETNPQVLANEVTMKRSEGWKVSPSGIFLVSMIYV